MDRLSRKMIPRFFCCPLSYYPFPKLKRLPFPLLSPQPPHFLLPPFPPFLKKKYDNRYSRNLSRIRRRDVLVNNNRRLRVWIRKLKGSRRQKCSHCKGLLRRIHCGWLPPLPSCTLEMTSVFAKQERNTGPPPHDAQRSS